MKFIAKDQRIPRRRDDNRYEICISCGHYIYVAQEIQFVPLGKKAHGNFKMSARHVDYIDCKVSINIGLPSSQYGPRREIVLDTSLQD
jgi:hypothetical protein